MLLAARNFDIPPSTVKTILIHFPLLFSSLYLGRSKGEVTKTNSFWVQKILKFHLIKSRPRSLFTKL